MTIQNWNPLIQLFNEPIRSIIIIVVSVTGYRYYAIGCIMQLLSSSCNPHPHPV